MVSPQCVYSDDVQDQIYVQNYCYNDYTGMAYPQCVFFDALQDLIFCKTLGTITTMYGFSPVCVRWCITRVFFLQNNYHNGYIEIASQCMYFDDLQDQIMCKILVTLITLEWLVLSLYSLMFYRFWLFLKTLGTIATLKWLLPSMCPLVSFRFTIKIKILAIEIARICFKTTLYLLNDIGISDTYVSN